jgi:hypothetical protein
MVQALSRALGILGLDDDRLTNWDEQDLLYAAQIQDQRTNMVNLPEGIVSIYPADLTKSTVEDHSSWSMLPMGVSILEIRIVRLRDLAKDRSTQDQNENSASSSQSFEWALGDMSINRGAFLPGCPYLKGP